MFKFVYCGKRIRKSKLNDSEMQLSNRKIEKLKIAFKPIEKVHLVEMEERAAEVVVVIKKRQMRKITLSALGIFAGILSIFHKKNRFYHF